MSARQPGSRLVEQFVDQGTGKVLDMGQRLGVKVAEVAQGSFQLCLPDLFSFTAHVYNERFDGQAAQFAL